MLTYFGLDYLETEESVKNLIKLPEETTVFGSGGGSCFAVGTLVRTLHGYTPIQHIKSGDLVLSYDRYDNIDYGLVSQLHTHTKEELNQEDVYSFELTNQEGLVYKLPDCTGNHAIYNATTKEHSEAKTFKVGDSLIDFESNEVKITSINITTFDSLPEDYKVYNFEVLPQHTYFVGDGTNWTRVHNGGGGKAQTARTPVEDPNSLQSTAVARVLEVISEGPIVGLVGLAGSIIGQVFVPAPYTLTALSSNPIANTTISGGATTFTDTGLLTLSSCTKDPTSVYETYDAGCYSPSTTAGSLIIRWKFGTQDKVQLVGLGSNLSLFTPANGAISSIDLVAASDTSSTMIRWGIRCNEDTTYSIVEAGVVVGDSQAQSDNNTVFSIEYASNTIVYKRNGAVIRTTTTTTGLTLYFIVLQATRSAIVNYIEIGQHVLGYLPSTLQGVYFNNTRVQNTDGTDNFYNVFVDIRLGLPNQTVISGFTDIETVVPVLSTLDILNGTAAVGVAPTTYISGQTSDTIWEEVLGIYNAWSIATYGTPMNREWTKDKDSKAAYDRLATQYLSIKASQTPGAAVPYVGSILNTNISSAILTISFPEGISLLDKMTGDLHGSSVSIAIDTRALPSGTWSEVLVKTITGKAVSAFEMDFRVQNPASLSSTWAYRVRRTSPDSMSITQKGRFTFARVTEIIEKVETYPNTALVGLIVSAESVGNSVPTRGYDVMGLIIQVPSNYNATTRVYTGFWDGTFIYAWTDNPAWILYDLIVNTRYGVNSYLNNYVNVDKWSFYNAAVYNDGLVPDGTYLPDGVTPSGGMEVRYTFNACVQTQTDAWQFLHTVANVMQANIGVIGDVITLIQDRPTPVSKLINNSNVINGEFNYTSSSSTTRTTIVNTTFNERENDYLPRTISEQDNTGLAKYGFIMSDVVAFGVTKETSARRLAKHILYDAMNQTYQVSFSLGLNVVDISVGSVIALMDDNFASNSGEYYSGRIVSSTSTTVTLDRPISIVGTGWTIGVNVADYSGVTETLLTNGTGTYTTVNLSTTAVLDYSNLEFAIYKAGVVVYRQFRVGSITESSKGIYDIVATYYDPNKYDAIELGIRVSPIAVSAIVTTSKAPTGLVAAESHRTDGVTAVSYITLSWDYIQDTTIKNYILGYRRNNENYIFVDNIEGNYYELSGVLSGTYEFTLQSVNMYKKKSSSIVASLIYKNDLSSTLLPPTNIYVAGTTNTIFSATDCNLVWDYNVANDSVIDKLKDYVVEIYESTGLTKYNDYILPYNVSDPYAKGMVVSYTKAQIKGDFGSLPRAFQIKVYSRDTAGNLSIPAIVNITNPAPVTLTGLVVTGVGLNLNINLAACTISPDYSEFILAFGTTSTFTPTKANYYYRGTANNYSNGFAIVAPDYGTYYIKLAIADTYDDENLNWSANYTIVMSATGTTIFVTPDTPTAFTLSQDSYYTPSGEQAIALIASWTAPTQPTTGYSFEWLDDTLGQTVYSSLTTTNTSLFVPSVAIGHTYKAKVASMNVNEISPYTTVQTITPSFATVTMELISDLSYVGGVDSITLTWVNPTSSFFDHVEVWFSNTNIYASATFLASVTGTTHTWVGLAATTSGYVWLKAVDRVGNISAPYPVVDPTHTAGFFVTLAKVAQISVDSKPNGTFNIVDPVVTGSAVSAPYTYMGSSYVDITVTWAYTQGTIAATEFILYSYDVNDPYANGNTPTTVFAIKIPITDTSYTFTGALQANTYIAGIAASNTASDGRHVATGMSTWSYTGIGSGSLYISPARPNGLLSITTTTISGVDVSTPIAGLVNLTVHWDYVAGSIAHTGFTLFTGGGTVGLPNPVYYNYSSVTVGPTIRSHTFYGIPQDNNFTAAIQVNNAGDSTIPIFGWTYTTTLVINGVSINTLVGYNLPVNIINKGTVPKMISSLDIALTGGWSVTAIFGCASSSTGTAYIDIKVGLVTILSLTNTGAPTTVTVSGSGTLNTSKVDFVIYGDLSSTVTAVYGIQIH